MAAPAALPAPGSAYPGRGPSGGPCPWRRRPLQEVQEGRAPRSPHAHPSASVPPQEAAVGARRDHRSGHGVRMRKHLRLTATPRLTDRANVQPERAATGTRSRGASRALIIRRHGPSPFPRQRAPCPEKHRPEPGPGRPSGLISKPGSRPLLGEGARGGLLGLGRRGRAEGRGCGEAGPGGGEPGRGARRGLSREPPHREHHV